MHARRLACASLVALVLVGCGSIPADDDGGVPDAGRDAAPPHPCDVAERDLDDLFECVFSLTCEELIACGAAYTDVADCFQLVEGNAEIQTSLRRLKDSIAAGRMDLDDAQIDDCVTAYRAQIAGGECGLPNPGACNALFVGQVAAGAACYQSQECAGSGSRCDGCTSNDQCCAGTCTAAVDDGEACGNDEPCQAGSRCVGVDADQRFCRDGGQGSPCSEYYDCDEELYCAGDVCQPDVGVGRVCADTPQCQAPAVCIDGTCQRAVEGDDCVNRCEFGFACVVPPAGGPGTCVALPDELGESCVEARSCVQGLNCVAGQCAEPAGAGDPCTSGSCAPGLFCSSELADGGGEGTCEMPLADGATCGADRHCASGVCAGEGARVCQAYQVCE